MFIVSPSTLYNARALETRNVPKRMIGRISIIPRRDASWRLVVRLVFQVQVLRYIGALLPFVIAMFIWPHLALPISQAPIPMLFVIYFVETRVFSMPKDKRQALISEDDANRTLDALEFNGRRLLTKIAALKDLQTGELHLTVEQSELARVTPLTLVSIQLAGPDPQVLDLDETERGLIEAQLFDDTLSEEQLHLVTLREGKNLRSVVIDASEISAHARMAAMMEAQSATVAMTEAAL